MCKIIAKIPNFVGQSWLPKIIKHFMPPLEKILATPLHITISETSSPKLHITKFHSFDFGKHDQLSLIAQYALMLKISVISKKYF